MANVTGVCKMMIVESACSAKTSQSLEERGRKRSAASEKKCEFQTNYFTQHVYYRGAKLAPKMDDQL